MPNTSLQLGVHWRPARSPRHGEIIDVDPDVGTVEVVLHERRCDLSIFGNASVPSYITRTSHMLLGRSFRLRWPALPGSPVHLLQGFAEPSSSAALGITHTPSSAAVERLPAGHLLLEDSLAAVGQERVPLRLQVLVLPRHPGVAHLHGGHCPKNLRTSTYREYTTGMPFRDTAATFRDPLLGHRARFPNPSV